MDWLIFDKFVWSWDLFQNVSFLCLLLVAIIAVLFLIFALISGGILAKNEDHYYHQLKSELNTIRIFVIYLDKDAVLTCSRSDFKNKKMIDFATFYSQFALSEVGKIKAWINSIIDGRNDSPYLETLTAISKNTSNKELFSILKCYNYNKEKGIIHLEMEVLKSITPLHEGYKKKSKGGFLGKQTMGTVSNYVAKSRSTRGFTFAIRITYFNKLAFKDLEKEKLMSLRLKDAIYPYVNDRHNPRQMVEVDESNILITDLRIKNQNQASRLAASMYDELKRASLLNDYQEYLKFTIGYVDNYMFYRDFNAISKHAMEASLIADQEGERLYFYQKSSVPELNKDRYKEEIDKLIRDEKIRYLYRPIVNVKKKEVFGYLESIKTYDSPFSNYNELIKYANICNKSHDLFAVVAKNVIPRFASEIVNTNTPLFYNVSIFDFADIKDVFPKISRSDIVHIVLVFKESEINQNNSHIDEILDNLQKLKIIGYHLALSMMDKSLLLDDGFYNTFDYFIAGTSMTGELKKNQLSLLSLRALIESLLKYKKPIIATGLEGWQSVELMIKSGINYVSSEAISASSEMVLPVEKKKLKKLYDLL